MSGEKEIWKSIEGYDGLYEISSCGNVRKKNSKQLLKLINSKNRSTIRVRLYKDGKRKYHTVSRLVMKAFYPYVIHKNGDYTDNTLGNLFYAKSLAESFRANEIMSNPISNPSIYTPRPIKNNLGNIYPTIEKAASVLDIEASSISRALANLQKTAGGFHWEYVEN